MLELYKVVMLYKGNPYTHHKKSLYESHRAYKLNFNKMKRWVNDLNRSAPQEKPWGYVAYKLVIENNEIIWKEIERL